MVRDLAAASGRAPRLASLPHRQPEPAGRGSAPRRWLRRAATPRGVGRGARAGLPPVPGWLAGRACARVQCRAGPRGHPRGVFCARDPARLRSVPHGGPASEPGPVRLPRPGNARCAARNGARPGRAAPRRPRATRGRVRLPRRTLRGRADPSRDPSPGRAPARRGRGRCVRRWRAPGRDRRGSPALCCADLGVPDQRRDRLLRSDRGDPALHRTPARRAGRRLPDRVDRGRQRLERRQRRVVGPAAGPAPDPQWGEPRRAPCSQPGDGDRRGGVGGLPRQRRLRAARLARARPLPRGSRSPRGCRRAGRQPGLEVPAGALRPRRLP